MVAEEYLGRSWLLRRLRNGPHGQLIELYSSRLVKDGLARQGTWRSLNVVSGLLRWLPRAHLALAGLDEHILDRYLKHRARSQSIQPGDRAALKRLLAVLRDASLISPVSLPPILPEDQILNKFADYLRQERGLASKTIVRHRPVIRGFLREACPAGASDLDKIKQKDVIRYIERHAWDWSPASGKAMCCALRTFLRYVTVRPSGSLTKGILSGCALAKLISHGPWQ